MDQTQDQPIAMEQAEAPVEAPAEAPVEAPAEPETVAVCDVRFRNGTKVYFFDPNGLAPKEGDHLIIDTARGPEFGYCAGGVHQVPASQIVPPLRVVLRLATEADEKVNSDNRLREQKAYAVCLQKIADFKLDMQLVSAECAFDGSKILFFFTADERVDFRELVKNLASVFRTRIELRQIGVRDKAKMVGGLGICGRPFCCKQFLDDFQPVSIKMAKTQNLSLNPTKISGTCGRLMCCLKYEQDAYESLLQTSPKPESFVDTPDGRGTVVEQNLLRQTVRVRMEDRPDEIGCYQNSEICILRNGKGKKNDPPIPRDLAPISGGKTPARRTLSPTAPQEQGPLLDSIIIKSMPEDIPAVEAASIPAEARPQRSRGGRSDRSRAKADRPAKPEQAPRPERPAKPEQPPRQERAAKAEQAPRPERSAERPPKQDTGKPAHTGKSRRKPYHPNSAPKREGSSPESEKAPAQGHAHNYRRNRGHRPRTPNPPKAE